MVCVSGLRTSSRRWRMRSNSWGSSTSWSTPWSITGRVSFICLFTAQSLCSCVAAAVSACQSKTHQLMRFYVSSTTQSCVGTLQSLPKAWPCWETLRTTQLCHEPCLSWQRWRTSWSICITSRQPVTSLSLRNCWPTTSVCWVLCGYGDSYTGQTGS